MTSQHRMITVGLGAGRSASVGAVLIQVFAGWTHPGPGPLRGRRDV